MRATIQYIKKELAGIYPETEIEGFIRLLFEWAFGWDYSAQILNRNRKIETANFDKIKASVARLKQFEPIQYIFGETIFFDLQLKVNPAVLIPRPETEELVNWILETISGKAAHILDIGTGSGCISLALKKNLPGSRVSAIDISDEALKTAKSNALLNNLDVRFWQADILKWREYNWPEFDVIVSNPPYVRQLEKKQMQPNVLKYEPEIALFVSNNNPLIFYSEIAAFAKDHLTKNGKLFFEINEFLGNDLKNLLTNFGFTNILMKHDINGKARMVFCER